MCVCVGTTLFTRNKRRHFTPTSTDLWHRNSASVYEDLTLNNLYVCRKHPPVSPVYERARTFTITVRLTSNLRRARGRELSGPSPPSRSVYYYVIYDVLLTTYLIPTYSPVYSVIIKACAGRDDRQRYYEAITRVIRERFLFFSNEILPTGNSLNRVHFFTIAILLIVPLQIVTIIKWNKNIYLYCFS